MSTKLYPSNDFQYNFIIMTCHTPAVWFSLASWVLVQLWVSIETLLLCVILYIWACDLFSASSACRFGLRFSISHASYLIAYRVFIKGGRDFATQATRSSELLTHLYTYSFKAGIFRTQGLVPFLWNTTDYVVSVWL